MVPLQNRRCKLTMLQNALVSRLTDTVLSQSIGMAENTNCFWSTTSNVMLLNRHCYATDQPKNRFWWARKQAQWRHERVITRDTREGWPLLLLTVKLNGDSKSTNKRVPSLVCSVGLSCRYKRFWYCPYTISIYFSPSPSTLGRQTCWVACLLVSLCLWLYNSAGKLTVRDGNRTIFTSMHRDYMYVLLCAKCMVYNAPW